MSQKYWSLHACEEIPGNGFFMIALPGPPVHPIHRAAGLMHFSREANTCAGCQKESGNCRKVMRGCWIWQRKVACCLHPIPPLHYMLLLKEMQHRMICMKHFSHMTWMIHERVQTYKCIYSLTCVTNLHGQAQTCNSTWLTSISHWLQETDLPLKGRIAQPGLQVFEHPCFVGKYGTK